MNNFLTNLPLDLTPEKNQSLMNFLCEDVIPAL